ncbi:hypothetical protein CYMTET_47156 [Cymbomonas tetramitiformis]|uniref:Uncharacterized protein n=1 Tax=Cymbomonas tetramitiformis TaxID=36881 RepID=A0AAE0BWR2_9CHLO|nr:hypothetical protein CYMTET_47156 [Cymbomonas tetramitiformis]
MRKRKINGRVAFSSRKTIVKASNSNNSLAKTKPRQRPVDCHKIVATGFFRLLEEHFSHHFGRLGRLYEFAMEWKSYRDMVFDLFLRPKDEDWPNPQVDEDFKNITLLGDVGEEENKKMSHVKILALLKFQGDCREMKLKVYLEDRFYRSLLDITNLVHRFVTNEEIVKKVWTRMKGPSLDCVIKLRSFVLANSSAPSDTLEEQGVEEQCETSWDESTASCPALSDTLEEQGVEEQCETSWDESTASCPAMSDTPEEQGVEEQCETSWDELTASCLDLSYVDFHDIGDLPSSSVDLQAEDLDSYGQGNVGCDELLCKMAM